MVFIQRRLQSPFESIVSVTWLLDPKNGQTEKCDVGQIKAVVALKKKWNSYCQKIKPWLPANPSFCVRCPNICSRVEWTLASVKMRIKMKKVCQKIKVLNLFGCFFVVGGGVTFSSSCHVNLRLFKIGGWNMCLCFDISHLTWTTLTWATFWNATHVFIWSQQKWDEGCLVCVL